MAISETLTFLVGRRRRSRGVLDLSVAPAAVLGNGSRAEQGRVPPVYNQRCGNMQFAVVFIQYEVCAANHEKEDWGGIAIRE